MRNIFLLPFLFTPSFVRKNGTINWLKSQTIFCHLTRIHEIAYSRNSKIKQAPQRDLQWLLETNLYEAHVEY